MRRRDIHRPATCGRLGRRRKNVSQRAVPKREAGIWLSAPAYAARLFAAGIVATNAWVKRTYGKDFDRLPAKDRDDVLKALDQGKAERR